MIFIMSVKQWNKNKKKLVEPKEYIIVDGTDDDAAKMSSYTNVVTIDSFCPPASLIKLISKDNDMLDIMDIDKIEDLEDRFFDGNGLKNAIVATIASLLENDINIFLVLRNKVYKQYRKKLRKTFVTLLDVSAEFVKIFEGNVKDIRKELQYTLSEGERTEMQEAVRKLEKRMEKRMTKKRRKR